MVEHELVGGWAGLHLVNLAGALLGEMAVDHVRGEHLTLQQKGVVDASAQRFLEQAGANGTLVSSSGGRSYSLLSIGSPRTQGQTASGPCSPVRIRTAWSTGTTKILPSPILSVRAAS